MKKTWFMMLLMCAVSVFTACSDDDGEKEVLNPVTGVSVPATGKIGNEIIIRGTGFTTSGIAIYLENASQDRFKMDASFNNAGASFTVPYTLEVGSYYVLLTQDTEEWTLGTVTLESADNPILALTLPDTFVVPGKESLIGGNGYAEGDKIVLQQGDATPVEIANVIVTDQGLQFTVPDDCTEGVYTITLVRGASSWILGDMTVQKLRRIKKLMGSYYGMAVSLDLSYDKEGRLSSIVSDEDGMKWDLEYGNNVIKTTSVMAAGVPLEYTLEKGRIVRSIAFDAEDETETYNNWTYDGDYLKSVANEGKDYVQWTGTNLTVTYKEGNLSALEECQCTYEYGENALNAVPNTIDPGYVLQLPVLLMGDEDTAIALLCNATGKTSAKVPTQISVVTGFTENGDYMYTSFPIDSKREGEVLKMTSELYEAEITYEVY